MAQRWFEAARGIPVICLLRDMVVSKITPRFIAILDSDILLFFPLSHFEGV